MRRTCSDVFGDCGTHRSWADSTTGDNEHPGGRHTFAVEDDEPVHVAPLVTRNALEAGMYLMHPHSRPAPLTHKQSLDWVMGLAAEPLGKRQNGKEIWRNASSAASMLESGRPLSHDIASEPGLVLAVAERVLGRVRRQRK